MVQVQLRMPDKMVEKIDREIKKGEYRSRSDAIKTIVSLHEERENTKKFLKMLMDRSKNAKEHPDKLIPFDEV